MLIYQVIKHHYCRYESNYHNATFLSDDIEVAAGKAVEIIKNEIKPKQRIRFLDIGESHFLSDYIAFSSMIPDLFLNEKPDEDYFTKYYVVEVPLNTEFAPSSLAPIWTLEIETVFEWFCEDMNTIFENGSIEKPSESELQELFELFRRDRKSFTAPYVNAKGYLDLEPEAYLAMLSANQKEIELFEKYELNA